MQALIGLVGGLMLMAVAMVGGLAISIGFSVLMSFPLMWAWNYVMPFVFQLPVITWQHAFCLMFVSNMLIKAFNPSLQTSSK